jgi:iron(III) transport system ATP-binding protein
MTGLKLQGISHLFGTTLALDNINAEIKDSEFVAILGPSGCGKTTLLRVIGGFLRPSSGKVTFRDQMYSSSETHVPVEKRDLGMVFQSFALWPHMTVREHVEFPLHSPRHKDTTSGDRQDRVDRTLEAVGLMELQNRYPGELSGGQRQRVSLARAIVSRPSILLMDEPLSALDQELRVDMRREIQDIHRLTGATVIYVTHDQGEALAMANRMIIIKDGKIEQIGTPRDVYLTPQTPFVASFVSKCNFVRGTWSGDHFFVKNQPSLIYEGKEVASAFRRKGIFPVRPEQFFISTEEKGLEGEITNKQYSGREIHYSVSCQGEIFTVYSDTLDNYNTGDHVRLTFSGEVQQHPKEVWTS